MRRLPRKPLNPGWIPPREYLQGGLSDARTGEVREDLLGDRAAALGRQLLLDGVPIEAVGQLVRELEAIARLAADPAAIRQRLTEISGRPATMRHPLLAQLMAVAAAQVRRESDLKALTAHLRRAASLANVSRVLVGASLVEMARAQRATQVRKHRPRR